MKLVFKINQGDLMIKNIFFKWPVVACLFLALSSCSSQVSQSTNSREYQIGAYLWVQHSGEYKALTYQAYNIAREKFCVI